MRKSCFYDGEEFTLNGREYKVNIPDDDSEETPWEASDGRGVVTDWVDMDASKKPGWRKLTSNRHAYRYYDMQATTAKAKAEDWGLSDDEVATLGAKLGRTPMKAQIVAESVERDYRDIQAWCNDEWRYVGVIVEDLATGEKDSVWGIESYCDSYIAETAYELAHQLQAISDAATAHAIQRSRQDLAPQYDGDSPVYSQALPLDPASASEGGSSGGAGASGDF